MYVKCTDFALIDAFFFAPGPCYQRLRRSRPVMRRNRSSSRSEKSFTIVNMGNDAEIAYVFPLLASLRREGAYKKNVALVLATKEIHDYLNLQVTGIPQMRSVEAITMPCSACYLLANRRCQSTRIPSLQLKRKNGRSASSNSSRRTHLRLFDKLNTGSGTAHRSQTE